MVKIESVIAAGVEEDIFNAHEDKKIVGKHTLREYFETNRDIWVKQSSYGFDARGMDNYLFDSGARRPTHMHIVIVLTW